MNQNKPGKTANTLGDLAMPINGTAQVNDAMNATDKTKFRDFLANSPPGSVETIPHVFAMEQVSRHGPRNMRHVVRRPVVELPCELCDGVRSFSCYSYDPDKFLIETPTLCVFLEYQCRNCESFLKTYALKIESSGTDQHEAKVTKIGEWPPFGPSTPARFVKLIGPDRELFLKGRRAEFHGLGIGAFAYYRRVVENNKHRLINAIIDVARKTGATADTVSQLQAANSETQFTKAIEAIKDAIPDAIRIKGYNPLTLLHGPLSEHLHDKTDDECLALATDVREVLFAMSERIGEALKEQNALDNAVNRLSQRRGT